MSSQKIPEDNLPVVQETAPGAVEGTDDPFADPGLPAHKPRIQDIDERAANRSERAVAFMFTLSMLSTVGFIASYVIFPVDKIVYIWPFGHVSPLNFSLGLTLGFALFFIGAGAVHWARTLMSDVEVADERHPIEATPRSRPRSSPTSRPVPRSPRSAAASSSARPSSVRWPWCRSPVWCCCATSVRSRRRSSGPRCGPRASCSST